MGFALLCFACYPSHTHTHPYPKSFSISLQNSMYTSKFSSIFNASGANISFLSHIDVNPTHNLLLNLPVICFLVSTSIFFLLQQNVREVTKLKVYIALLLIHTRLQNHHYNVTCFPLFSLRSQPK